MNIDIEQNASRSVPNDEIAKLSYYLENIGGCIPGAIDAAYTQFKHFAAFSQETKEAIVKICEIMEPSILENNAIKQVNKCDLGSTDSDCENAFITLTERINLSIVNNNHDQVAGLNLTNRQVTKIMIYTETWIKNYYTTPLQKMKQKFARNNEPRRDPNPPMRAQTNNVPSNRQDHYIRLNPEESLFSRNSEANNQNKKQIIPWLDS